MTAISGAAMTLRTLADGSVRLTVDFEPKDRKAVMELFGSPGQPVGVAALQAGHAAVREPAPPASTFRDLGPICREAIDLCGNDKFLEYIGRPAMGKPAWKPTPDAAKGYILSQCGVESRKDLDAAEGARELFIEHVRKPFHAWLDRQGKAS